MEGQQYDPVKAAQVSMHTGLLAGVSCYALISAGHYQEIAVQQVDYTFEASAMVLCSTQSS